MSLRQTARLLEATSNDPWGGRPHPGATNCPVADAVNDYTFVRLAKEHAAFRAELRAIEKGA